MFYLKNGKKSPMLTKAALTLESTLASIHSLGLNWKFFVVNFMKKKDNNFVSLR
jgi:hypothetical protein